MVYVEIKYKNDYSPVDGLIMWYSRMKIDSTADEVMGTMKKYFLTNKNRIAIEDDISGESFEIFLCDTAAKTGATYCMQMLVPFGLIKEKFLL